MIRKRRKRQADKRWFGRELSALLSPESLPHDRHEQRQISYYYRATLTITVILAHAGTHSSAHAESFVSKSPYNDKHLLTKRQRPPLPSFSRTREPIHPRPPSASLAEVLTAASIYKRRDNVTITVILAHAGTHSSVYAESFVSKSPYNDKHLQTKRQRPPLPSFSRTREPICPRPPSASLAKVLTTTNIYKRRDNVPPSPSFSRTREPIHPRTPSASLAKVLTAVSIYKRRDNVPITVILANAGNHSSAYAECFVSKSPYSGKHLQTKRQCPHHRHYRERGNPFIRVRRVLR
ncbi:Uncharacterised protein [Vibrio vulnificus]|nr:hypothetical protein VVMO6_01077 [Vibrio vulnificus MO6-24/O]SUP38485.1 Uncharacterised protein [Vibrio vulnificus]